MIKATEIKQDNTTGYELIPKKKQWTSKTSTNPINKKISKYIGQRIKERRRALGCHQKDLAKYLGISLQQYGKYELAYNSISASFLYKISLVLAVSMDYFVKGLEDELAEGEIEARSSDARSNKALMNSSNPQIISSSITNKEKKNHE